MYKACQVFQEGNESSLEKLKKFLKFDSELSGNQTASNDGFCFDLDAALSDDDDTKNDNDMWDFQVRYLIGTSNSSVFMPCIYLRFLSLPGLYLVNQPNRYFQ